MTRPPNFGGGREHKNIPVVPTASSKNAFSLAKSPYGVPFIVLGFGNKTYLERPTDKFFILHPFALIAVIALFHLSLFASGALPTVPVNF